MPGPADRLARIGAAAAALALACCSLDPASLPGGSLLGPTVSGKTVGEVPGNALERAIALCPEKTEDKEKGCIRTALVDGRLGPAAIAGMIPGCRLGQSCTLTYRTRDRMGLLAVTAAQYVADWLVTFDLRNAQASPADVPIDVAQI